MKRDDLFEDYESPDFRAKLDIPQLAPEEEHQELEKVQTYLYRLNYLPEVRNPARLDRATQIALKKFQAFYHLKQTGTTDAPTVEHIQKPRCGTPDPQPDLRLVSDEFVVEIQNAGLGVGCAYLGVNELKYSISNQTQDLPRNISFTRTKGAIDRAFATWQSKIPINFVFANGDSNPTFKIKWAKDAHGDNQAFDFIRGLIGHAYYPKICGNPYSGQCHFDRRENWGFSHIQEMRKYDIETAALHEIGHLLGLKHSDQPGSIMYPDYIFSGDIEERRQLSPDVVTVIQQIYGIRNPA